MTDPVRIPPGVESLIRAIAGGTGAERDQRASTFARGLALGALVGAAIAGSTIWQRRAARQGQDPSAATAAAPDPGAPAESPPGEPDVSGDHGHGPETHPGD